MAEERIEEPEKETGNYLWGQKAPMTIIGVLLFGIVCSALYDFLIKPGINVFSELLFNLLTFGSQLVKDYSFNTAALDPTSIPSLVLLTIVACFAVWFPMRKIFQLKIMKDRLKQKSFSIRTIFFIKWIVLPILLIILIAITFIPLNIFNQAVLTWRIFHSNIAILVPVVSDDKIAELKSRFATMHTESDYLAIYSDMKQIADSKNVKLREERPW